MVKYDDWREVTKILQEAEVPMNDRVMYYFEYDWKRNPIKRWKQKRQFKKILKTL